MIMGSTNYLHDSRVTPPTLELRLEAREDGRQGLRAPTVGLWRDPPPDGARIVGGSPVGRLEVLGVIHHLIAPAGVCGLVVRDPAVAAAAGDRGPRARRPVAFDELLLVVDPAAAGAGERDAELAAAPAAGSGEGLVLRAPTSGRFYRRPAPDRPAFVSEGAIVTEGQVIGLLEVMKTFTRIHYGGGDLPPRARVTGLSAGDEADVAAGEPLLFVEPAPE